MPLILGPRYKETVGVKNWETRMYPKDSDSFVLSLFYPKCVAVSSPQVGVDIVRERSGLSTKT